MMKQMKLQKNFLNHSKKVKNTNLESIKINEIVFNYVHLLHYKYYTVNLNCSGSYKDSPGWIKNKKATINPINKKVNKCFQYAVTGTLSHEDIGKHSERITKLNLL